MNERLKELAGQAKFIAEEAINKKISKNAELDAFAEKLVELVIQECIDEIKKLRGYYDTHQDVEPDENDWYIDAFLQAEVRLKHHFGVVKE
jgi:hypothetical protein